MLLLQIQEDTAELVIVDYVEDRVRDANTTLGDEGNETLTVGPSVMTDVLDGYVHFVPAKVSSCQSKHFFLFQENCCSTLPIPSLFFQS